MEIKLMPKIRLFACKLITGKLPTMDNLTKTGMNFDADCPSCGSH